MTDLLHRYAAFVVRHAWSVLIGALLVVAILASGITRLVVNLDPDQQLPADHPYVKIDRQIRKEFGGTNFVAIALLPKSGTIWRRDVLQAVSDLTFDLLNAPGVIRQNVASLSSPYVRVPMDRDGVLTTDYLMREVPPDAAGVAALREVFQREPLLKGSVVSDDERAALILVDFYDDVGAPAIGATVERAVAKYRSAGIDIAVTGAPIFENMEGVLMQRQGEFFVATLAAIVAVLWLSFGQIQGVILPSATALLSAALALGCMGLAGIPMNSWTAAAPLVVVTVGAGHSAQMLKRYYEEFARCGDRAAAVIAATTRIGMVMMAAGATAGIGFASMAALGIPTLTQFGLSVAFGIFAAVLLEMTFMLALRVVWPTGRAHGGEGPLSRWLGWVIRPLENAVASRPQWILWGFLAVVLLAATGFPRLSTEVNSRKYWSERTPVGRDLRIFEQHFPGITTLTILLEGEPGSMRTLEAIDTMTGLQQVMAQEPGVVRTSSIADIIRRTYEVFAPEEAVHGLPAEPPLIAQLFYLSESEAFEHYVDRASSRSVVFGYLEREDSALARRVLDRLQVYVAQHPSKTIHISLAGGVAPTLVALNDDTVKGKMLNIGVVLAVIVVVTSLLLRTVLGGLYVAAPLIMALVVNIGVFAWLGVAFDLSGASIAAIGVSIGADYAIYSLYRLREEFRRSGQIEEALHATMATTGRALLFVSLAISAGFGVYSLSDFYAFQILGAFVPLTMLVSCLTALTLLPALVIVFRPAFIFGAAARRAGEAVPRAVEQGCETPIR